jgi:hypothetical protein
MAEDRDERVFVTHHLPADDARLLDIVLMAGVEALRIKHESLRDLTSRMRVPPSSSRHDPDLGVLEGVALTVEDVEHLASRSATLHRTADLLMGRIIKRDARLPDHLTMLVYDHTAFEEPKLIEKTPA